MKAIFFKFHILIFVLLLSCVKKNQESDHQSSVDSILSQQVVVSDLDTIQLRNGMSEEEYLDLTQPCRERKPVITGQTEHLIIKSAFFNPIDILKDNAAILITDKNEIVTNEKLFFNNNEPYIAACGFHYDLQFYDKDGNIINDIPYNIECTTYCFDNDKIRTQVLNYAKILSKKPTHYIYNLIIEGKHSPDDMLKLFRQGGLNVFFIEGKNVGCTSLSITCRDYGKKTTEKIKVITNEIKNILPVIEYTEPHVFWSSNDENKASAILYFRNGTDLSEAINLAKRCGVEEVKANTPRVYKMQILHESDNIDVVKNKLKEYKLIKEITIYNPNGSSCKEDFEKKAKAKAESKYTGARPFVTVEQMPEFPGGKEAMEEFIKKNLKHPSSSKNVKGRVTIRFVVTETGKIADIQVIRGIDKACDDEAVRVIKSMPKWTPGKQGRKSVPVYYTIPIFFD